MWDLIGSSDINWTLTINKDDKWALIWWFPQIGAPQIIHFSRIFHYKLPFWGTPILGNLHIDIILDTMPKTIHQIRVFSACICLLRFLLVDLSNTGARHGKRDPVSLQYRAWLKLTDDQPFEGPLVPPFWFRAISVEWFERVSTIRQEKWRLVTNIYTRIEATNSHKKGELWTLQFGSSLQTDCHRLAIFKNMTTMILLVVSFLSMAYWH